MVVESKAKLTMVPVWATWCVPCIKEMPHLAEFYEKEHKNGLEIIGLCVGDKTDEDDAESMSEKIAELKSPFHHYILPAVPALTVLVGMYLVDLQRETGSSRRLQLLLASCLVRKCLS